MPRQFDVPASATLDATGAGTAQLGPTGGEDWIVTVTSVSTSTAVLQPQANLFKNGTSAGSFHEGTFSGSSDASDTRYLLEPGDVIYCVWSGGDVGARATLRIKGVAVPAGQGISVLAGLG